MITDALAETVAAVRLIVPLDVVQLVQVTFTGVAALGGVFATVYAIAAKQNSEKAAAKAAEVALAQAQTNLAIMKVKEDVNLIERNTNSMQTTIEKLAREKGQREGEARADQRAADTAATLAEGQKQGAEAERASPSPIGTKPPQ